MTRFRVILISVATFLFVYLGLRLQSDVPWINGVVWLVLLISFSVVLAMPFWFWGRLDRKFSRREKRFLWWAQNLMAYLNFLIALVVLRELVILIDYLITRSWLVFDGPSQLGLLALPLVFKIWGWFVTHRGAKVYQQEIADSKLPAEFSGYRVLQISDLHIGLTLWPHFVDELVDQVNAQAADLIVMTGDIVDGLVEEYAGEIQKLARLRAKDGVVFVSGNHEYYWGFPKIQKALEACGVKVLTNQSVAIRRAGGELLVAGIPDPAAGAFKLESVQLEKAASGFRENQYRILLAHQPVVADLASQFEFHLQLSGHTHAGQFFPWNLLIGLFQKYSKGLYQVGSLKLYVNQGTGYWGPALRVGTECELTELILKNP